MSERAHGSPRSLEGRAPSAFRRVLDVVRSPLFGDVGPAQRAASEGDDRAWVRSGLRSSSMGAARWESTGRQPSNPWSTGVPFYGHLPNLQ